MNSLKSFTALFFSLLFLTGCYRNYEVYDFQTKEVKFSWGVVGAKLVGSEKLTGNTIVKGSPYELLIWFGSDKLIEGSVQIIELKLINEKNNKVFFKRSKTLEEAIKKHTIKYRAYFSFNDVEIDHDNMVLYIKFLLKQKGEITEYKAEINFNKNYQEFRRIIGA